MNTPSHGWYGHGIFFLKNLWVTPLTDIARVPYSTYYWSPPVCPLIRLYCRALILWRPQGKRMANQLSKRPAISGDGYLWVEVGWLTMVIDSHDFCLHFVTKNMLLTVQFHFWLIKDVWQVPGTFETKHVHSSQMELYFLVGVWTKPFEQIVLVLGHLPNFRHDNKKTFQTTTQFFTPTNFGCRSWQHVIVYIIPTSNGEISFNNSQPYMTPNCTSNN